MRPACRGTRGALARMAYNSHVIGKICEDWLARYPHGVEFDEETLRAFERDIEARNALRRENHLPLLDVAKEREKFEQAAVNSVFFKPVMAGE
jgi:hypothetical protein